MSLDIEQSLQPPPSPSSSMVTRMKPEVEVVVKEEASSNCSRTLIMNSNSHNNSDDDDNASHPGTLVVNEDMDHGSSYSRSTCCWFGTTTTASKGSVTFWFFAVITVLLIAGGTIAAVFVLVTTPTTATTNRSNMIAGMNSTTTSSSSSSSPPLQSEAYYQERYAIFQTLVVNTMSSLSSSSIMLMNTPQYKAFQWMVYDDTTIKHEPLVTPSSDVMTVQEQQWFLQRYAIMVLFYTCGGEEWELGSSSGGGGDTSTSGSGSSIEELGQVETCDWGIATTTTNSNTNDHWIACDTTTNEIVALQFDQKRLSGSLPDELHVLTSLVTLDMSYNFLKGSLPSNMFLNMIQLQTLRLNNNEFIGPLPTLDGGSKLQELTMGYNYFTGTIPSGYESLIAMQHFNIKELSLLDGPFFSMVGTNWTQLQSLIVDGCTSLTGTIPSQVLSSWSDSIIDLQLGLHSFSGTFPSDEIGTFTQLTNFISIGNLMSGPFPNIKSLTNLKYLTIQGPNITGTIPSSIGTVQELKELSIRFTSMSGTIPTEIGACTKLELLTITNTNINGTIPFEITNNVPTLSLITLQDNIGLEDSSIPNTLCPYIESGLLHLSISCHIQCSCCIDQCTASTPTTGGE